LLTLLHREQSVQSSFKGQQKPRQQAHIQAITQPKLSNETHEEFASKWEQPTTEHAHTSALPWTRQIRENSEMPYIHT